ncbi:MAG: glycosyltransferase family 39 protein [Chloroflexi bacterium]|nr:glycosyltransferase family 39 protein [Chloroflexota bacterium]
MKNLLSRRYIGAPALLWIILVIGFGLRLAYVLPLDPLTPYGSSGGDEHFYLDHGYTLVTDQPLPGVDISVLSQPPVYFIIVGAARAVFGEAGGVVAVRLIQALMLTTVAYCAYRLTWRIADERAGLIAAAFVAVNPIFILDGGKILTETTYIFFISLGLTVYVDSLAAASAPQRTWGRLVLVGALFGLATLTRAVLLLFPLGLAIHLLIVYRGRAWGKIGVLLLAYALVVSTWTVYNLARWQRFVIAGEGLPAFLYMSVVGWDDPFRFDQQLNENLGQEASNDMSERQGDYLEAASNQIGGNIGGYLQRRVGELASAYLQPHGTTLFSGESLRDLAVNWLRDDRSLAGIGRVIGGEQFFPKLLLYVFHYLALIFGVIGAWRSRRQWRLTLPLLGFIAYVTLVHFFLLALPRYIFPTMLCWIVLASSQFKVDSKQLVQKP